MPLTQSFTTSELHTVKVENHWTSGTGTNAREKYYKMYLPVCDDPSKKELFFYVIDQFLDAMSADRLHLTTGSERYSKFRMVVEGSLRLTWQTISASRNNKTADSFVDLLHLCADEEGRSQARAIGPSRSSLCSLDGSTL